MYTYASVGIRTCYKVGERISFLPSPPPPPSLSLGLVPWRWKYARMILVVFHGERIYICIYLISFEIYYSGFK